MRIAINGMGRIGRLLFRRLIKDPNLTLVAVNDIMHPDNLCYLIRYDSLHGPLPEQLLLENGKIAVAGQKIRVSQEADPLKLDWRALDIDIILECSGRFANLAGASKHLQSGAKRVLLSTTGTPEIPLMIFGHNHATMSSDQRILSPGGCMTNCVTHILYIMNVIGIETGQINILHS